jgi:hypothetical protein
MVRLKFKGYFHKIRSKCCERHKLNYVFIFIVTNNRFEFIFSHSSHRDLLKANLSLEKYKILFFSLVSLCFYSK